MGIIVTNMKIKSALDIIGYALAALWVGFIVAAIVVSSLKNRGGKG